MVTTGPARLRIQTKVFRDHNDEDGGDQDMVMVLMVMVMVMVMVV